MDLPLFYPQSSICSVTYTRNGTGSLVKLHFSNGPRTFFMAPFQKVPISNAGDIDALKLSCEDKKFVKLKLEWVKRLWIYQNDQPKAGLTLIFEDKKFVVLKPDWVNNLWIKSNYQMNITVIEFESEMEMFARTNFKPLSAGSTLTGEKNGLNINTILETFQANLLKCGGQIHDKPDGLIPPQFSICPVESEYGKNGTGSFVKIEFPVNSGIMRHLFMTSFHVVQICLPDEVIGLKLKFGDNTISNVNLSPDWVKMLCALPNQLDVVVIEFSQTAMKILSGTNFASLLVAGSLEKKSICVYQYPKPDGRLAEGKGEIISIESLIIQYSAKTEFGSSGSPVLNENNKVIGIHCGIKVCENNKVIRQAIRIDEILKAFYVKLLEHYGGEKNLLRIEYLEWFEHSQKHLLGRSDNVEVYKIFIQDRSSMTAKIISGFGTTQVDALSKQLEVIKALPHHDRKILLREFLQDDHNARFLIFTEYLEGGSLLDKIKNYGRLSKTYSLKYLVEILEGLEFLHQQEKPVFHSNLKPSNILFTADDHIKLCDFGISIHFNNNAYLRQDCYFMSPEQHNGQSPSAASDIWSLGVTFVMMLTGHTINYKDYYRQVGQLIADYKISIDGVPLHEYLKSLNENDYRKIIISQTLCLSDNRVSAKDLIQLCQNLRDAPNLGIGHEIETTPKVGIPSASLQTQTAIISPEVKACWVLRSFPNNPLKFKATEDERDLRIVGMAGGQTELFIADSENRAVRSIKLAADPAATKLELQLVYRMPARENLKDIAYSPQTDTLLVISGALHEEHFTIRSLARPDSGSVWRESYRYTVNNVKSKAVQDNRCTLRVLSDGRLVFGVWGAVQLPPDAKSIRKLPTQALATSCQTVENLGDVLQVLTLTPDNSRKIQPKTCVKLPAPHSGFDAKIVSNASELLVAAALWFDSVALFRVDGESAKELYRFKSESPQLPLFYGDPGDKLLVSQCPDPTSNTPPGVQELRITGLQEDRITGIRIELLRTLNHIKNYWWTAWCIVPARLIVWAFETGQLTVYSTL